MNTVNKKIYLFANWKMYLDYAESVALASALAETVGPVPEHVVMAVFPSALALTAVAEKFSGSAVKVGAQNTYWVSRGGYTGEISANMCQAVGCEYVLVGHSERRHVFGETNHEVRQKIEAALAAGLAPVVCVGETMGERQAGQTRAVLEVQLRSAFEDLDWPAGRPLIVAYEPVWAISKGLSHNEVGIPCTISDAEAANRHIVQCVESLIPAATAAVLYGGSVRENTARDYLASPHVNGILVGAASTTLESWHGIVLAAKTL